MNYYASGKLLLFGEYLVLKGAKALAIPLKYGQQMQVRPQLTKEISWTANVTGKRWFSAVFTVGGALKETTNETIAFTLLQLFQVIKGKRPDLFESGYTFQLDSNFRLEWGLGSSSTLISLLSQWSKTDPYYLLEKSFGGSGYDVACATSDKPILFEGKNRSSNPVELSSDITSKILFIYSGQKQKSKSEVIRFDQISVPVEDIETMDQLVLQSIAAKNIEEWEILTEKSEILLGKILGKEPLKKFTFPEYEHSIKSLGAWGGDFFMVTYRNEKKAREYFNQKGYTILFNYAQIIKK